MGNHVERWRGRVGENSGVGSWQYACDFGSICGAERDIRVWGVGSAQGTKLGDMGPEHSRGEIL